MPDIKQWTQSKQTLTIWKDLPLNRRQLYQTIIKNQFWKLNQNQNTNIITNIFMKKVCAISYLFTFLQTTHFRNRRLMLDEIVQRNASKGAETLVLYLNQGRFISQYILFRGWLTLHGDSFTLFRKYFEKKLKLLPL